MRVKSATTSGSGDNELTVIRGALGTIQESHTSGEQVKKVKPIPIEFRRPSIIRASGHTFEYLGFGPVTIQLHFHRFRSEHLQKEKSS